MDAHPERLSLEALFEDYLRLMPEYQGVELSQLQLQRVILRLQSYNYYGQIFYT